MELLVDKNREYRRYAYNESEKIQLANAGLQWVLSSNVSAVGVVDDDLIIRFHNGSMYQYYGQGDKYRSILTSNSKGHWVWVNLRRKAVRYQKIGSLPFKADNQVTDDEIFQLVDLEALAVAQKLAQLGVYVAPIQNDLVGLFRP